MSTSVPRILLIDDDPVLLQGLCDMLTYRRWSSRLAVAPIFEGANA